MKKMFSFFNVFFVYPVYFVVAVAAFAAGITSLSCERKGGQVDCSLKDIKMMGLVNTTTQIHGLTNASVDDYLCRISDSDGYQRYKTCQRLLLSSADGDFYPNLYMSSVVKIVMFLSSQEESLTIHNGHWGFSAALCGFAYVWYNMGQASKRIETTQKKRGKKQADSV